MKDMRLRPRGDYLHAANWEELYALGEHWQSDMAYYKDELKFLFHLIDKYFKWLMNDNDVKKVQAMARDIQLADHEASRISDLVDEHQHRIAQFVKNADNRDELEFRKAHSLLENDLTQFVRNFRKVKKEVFAITEEVLESEKLSHLLTT